MSIFDNAIIKRLSGTVLSSFGLPESMLDIIATKESRDLTGKAVKLAMRNVKYKDMLFELYNEVIKQRGIVEYQQQLSETPEQTKERLRGEFEAKKQLELAAKSPDILKQREADALAELEKEFAEKIKPKSTEASNDGTKSV